MRIYLLKVNRRYSSPEKSSQSDGASLLAILEEQSCQISSHSTIWNDGALGYFSDGRSKKKKKDNNNYNNNNNKKKRSNDMGSVPTAIKRPK